jgi:hypothetical protein
VVGVVGAIADDQVLRGVEGQIPEDRIEDVAGLAFEAAWTGLQPAP